ncbi:uncharacterized protein G2W53_031743 [Senna tora]|uniref:Uncharacterized protein n=1 Tax=Senna tora TaxID=362788 RepID=A0A834SZA3_9FABA|nr:uncharacterized protein G2W53_031743 [Senna tora]
MEFDREGFAEASEIKISKTSFNKNKMTIQYILKQKQELAMLTRKEGQHLIYTTIVLKLFRFPALDMSKPIRIRS